MDCQGLRRGRRRLSARRVEVGLHFAWPMTMSNSTTTLVELLAAIVADEARAVALVRAMPEIAQARVSDERLVAEVPHQLYAGDTALHLAAAALRPLAVKALIEAGADSNAGNRRGATALHYACDARPNAGKTWDPSRQRAVIELLLDGGSDLEHKDKAGATPLHRAVAPGVPRPFAVSSSAALVWTRLTAGSARPFSTPRPIRPARAERRERSPSSTRSSGSCSNTGPILAREPRMETFRGLEHGAVACTPAAAAWRLDVRRPGCA